MDKNLIRKEAREILDKFAKLLDGVDVDEGDFHFSRDDFLRLEEDGFDCAGFKKKLLKNAPCKNEDFVLVEKGGWKNG